MRLDPGHPASSPLDLRADLRRALDLLAQIEAECQRLLEENIHLRLALNERGTTPKLTLREMLEAVEKDALQDALKRARGNRAKAARLLGTTERVFNYGVRKYGIEWRRFKS